MASPPIDSALTLALEHQTRSLLSELDKRLSAMDVKWESRVGELESQVSASSRRLDSVTTDLRADVEIQFSSAADHLHQIEADVKTRVAALQSTMHVFELWRPRVEASVESLHSSVDSICAEVSKMGIRWSTDARVDGSGQPGLLGAHGSGSGRVPAPEEPPDRPRFGSCFENYYRDSGHVHPGADAHYPVTGSCGIVSTSGSCSWRFILCWPFVVEVDCSTVCSLGSVARFGSRILQNSNSASANN